MNTDALIVFMTLFAILFILYSFFQKRIKDDEPYWVGGILVRNLDTRPVEHDCDFYCYPRQQQQHVFNISSRVQGQEGQLPTGNAHLPIDQINVISELNKPIYDDAPPSYEEAMKLAIALSNSTTTSTHTNTDSAGTQQVVPAVPKTAD